MTFPWLSQIKYATILISSDLFKHFNTYFEDKWMKRERIEDTENQDDGKATSDDLQERRLQMSEMWETRGDTSSSWNL